MTALRLVDAIPGAGGDDPDLEDYCSWALELRGHSPNTVRLRREVLKRLTVYLGKPLRHLTEADLLRWEQGAVSGRAPESRRAYVSCVRAFFGWAVKTRIVAADPTTRLTQPTLHRALPRPMHEDDLREAVSTASPKLRVMLLLGAFCGLRCQEIAGLHWSDLNTAGGAVTLLVREGKGGKERVVPVPAVVFEAMLAYGRRRSGPMFYGRDAAQLRPHSASQLINGHLKRLGIDAKAHQLRHRYATAAYRLTRDIRMVQELLGHSSPQTTARYAAYDQSQTADMVAKLDEGWQAGGESTGSVRPA